VNGLAAFVPASQPIFEFAFRVTFYRQKMLYFKHIFLNYWLPLPNFGNSDRSQGAES
jgi:hypothetical protein